MVNQRSVPLNKRSAPQSRSEELLKLYKKLGFVYGSCPLVYEKNKNNVHKKKPYYKPKWEKETNSFIDEKHNGFYIITGKKSNISVIDIDTLDNFAARELKIKCDECCNMIATTKKGYHYFFVYDSRLKSSTCSKVGIDCRSDNANIFCEPCWYNDENNIKFEYKFTTLPVGKLKNIPDDVLNFYLKSVQKEDMVVKINSKKKNDAFSNLTNTDIKYNELDILSNKSSSSYTIIKDCIFGEDNILLEDLIKYYNIDISKKYILTEYEKEFLGNKSFLLNIARDMLKRIVQNLNIERNNDYNLWLQIGMILVKFGDYGITLWKDFSKMSVDGKLNPQYNGVEIDKKVKTFNSTYGLTFFSLLFWLKKDNYSCYVEIISNYSKLINYIHSIKDQEYTHIENILSGPKSDMSIFLSKILKDTLICNSENIYHWNDVKNIWVLKNHKRLSYVIVNVLNAIIKDEINRVKLLIDNEVDSTKKELLKNKQKYLMRNNIKYGDDKYCETLINIIYEELREDVDILFDNNTHVVNFKNGLYDLKENCFRSRVQTDYITKYLNYDYSSIEDTIIIEEIKQKMLNISNDDPILLEFNLSWFGYCLTGETKEHACNFIIGYSASNGKSSLAKMFHYSFPIYATELDRSAFIKGNAKSHKFLCDLEVPVRFAYCEELEQENLDVNKIKHIVTAKSFKNEVLFSTNKDIITQAKLTFISNFDPKFSSDEGIKRRGLMQILKNRFLPKSEYDDIDDVNKLGIYVRDEHFDSKFCSNIYKLSFFHILAPYANKYFNTNSLSVPKMCKIMFKNLCADNDIFSEFVSEHYEITGNPKDLVSKDEFVETYNMLKNQKVSWNDIISKVKNIVPYERDKRLGNKRGCLIGLKFIENEEMYFDD